MVEHVAMTHTISPGSTAHVRSGSQATDAKYSKLFVTLIIPVRTEGIAQVVSIILRITLVHAENGTKEETAKFGYFRVRANLA